MMPGFSPFRVAFYIALVLSFYPSGLLEASRHFVDVSGDVGLQPYSPALGMTAGASAADYDNDGDIDFFVPNEAGVADQLYENQDNGSFLEIAAQAGVDSLAFNRVGLFFDADNDNLLDLLVAGDCFCDSSTCIDPACLNDLSLVFYRQTTPGYFEEATIAAGFTADGIIHGLTHIGGLSAGDINNDGFLDVFLGLWHGAAQLFLNQTDGTFADTGAAAGIADPNTHGWQPMTHDFNGDGFLDIYENIDFKNNHFWVNLQNNGFSDMAVGLNVNNCVGSNCMNDMGLTLSDYDNDHDIDIFITNIADILPIDQMTNYNVLYQNDTSQGVMAFSDVSKLTGVAVGGWGWGCTFMELDNDGWVDLAVTNGFGYATVDASTFFKNNGGNPVTFSDVSDAVAFNDTSWGSALNAFDYDRDGYLDLLQVIYGNSYYQSPYQVADIRLLHNEDIDPNHPTTNHYLVVKPRMCGLNRRAIGATVEVTAGSLTMMRLISAGTSLQGQEPAEAHFGMGPNTVASQVVIHWPGNGGSTTLTNVAADQVITVTRPSPSDFDGSAKTDLNDFSILSSEWMQSGPGLATDLTGDETVNADDLELFNRYWLLGCP
jgi:hypothetical protein